MKDSRKTISDVPTESFEQQMLFKWAKLYSGKYPELSLMYHIPNEGKRNATTGRRMRCEGLKRGVPDIFLPSAKGGYHGMYIEMKRRKGGKVSPEQKEWLWNLRSAGYAVHVCKGWEDAADRILDYLQQKENAE